MNLLESELDYPFGDALPEPGGRLQVAPDIHWVRMPLPFALDHINLYLVEDRIDGRDGWTLIDCGIASEPTRQLWDQVFDRHLDGRPILRIVCTHTHPDHIGSASWIQARFGAPLWMTFGEYALGRVLTGAQAAADGSSTADHFARHGVPAGPALEALRHRGARYFRSLVPEMPASFRRIRGDRPLALGGVDWQVLIGTGHSPEHAALYEPQRRVLVSGDMVLPRISTNVSVFEIEPEADPVRWYLDSLDAFEACAPDTLVLPSHGRPFRQLHTRLRQQREHHAERLAEVLDACRERPRTGTEIVEVMFKRRFDTHQLTFALGEAIAHLHALWYEGRLSRTLGEDGVFRFFAAR